MVSIDVTIAQSAVATIIAVAGDIDAHTAADLQNAFTQVYESDHAALIVDLTATTFLDSTALGALVGIDNLLRPTGRSFALVCSNPRLLRVFRISRLDTVWQIHDTLDDASRALKPSH